jgi:DNA-binding NarL/FixJ family response regulator
MKRLLLIDDHEVVREGVKRILGEQPGAFAFGEASNTVTALRLVLEQDWDLAVLDLSLDGRGGLDLLNELKRLRPRLPVLILSVHSEEQYAKRAFKAGASGYVTKDSPRDELATAIQRVLCGGRYVSRSLAETLIDDMAQGTDGPPHECLSGREFEVMRLIASGKTVGEIAELLSLSDKTISTYRARILEKMDLKNNAELTHYAIQNRLTG